MKMKSLFRALCFSALLVPLLQGCIVTDTLTIADRKHYSEYRMQTERLNLDREKANLQPVKVMTFKEWMSNK